MNPFLLGSDANKFNEKNYKKWEYRILYWLNHLEVKYVLFEDSPIYPTLEGATKAGIRMASHAKAIWDRDDETCTYHLLESLNDELFEQFSIKLEAARELWDALRVVYLGEESGNQKYQVQNYLDFKMVDNKLILEKVR